MKEHHDIDEILTQWPFDPFNVNVRQLHLPGREVLQMRVDMGLLQMEIVDRPDGKRPHGAKTYFDYLTKKATQAEEFALDENHCIEIDREFVQYYHRRVCWLQLKEFNKAVADADHTLQLMDFCKIHSADEQWTISHEQYRPFVIYHRTQAAALGAIDEDENENDNPELAIEEVNRGLDRMRLLFEEYEADDQFEEDELVVRLTEFRDSLKERYKIGDPLDQQLAQAIELEDYEKAAEIRDMIRQSAIDMSYPNLAEDSDNSNETL